MIFRATFDEAPCCDFLTVQKLDNTSNTHVAKDILSDAARDVDSCNSTKYWQSVVRKMVVASCLI